MQLTFGNELRYPGFFIGLAGAVMAILAERRLGSHFSQGLELRTDHQLL